MVSMVDDYYYYISLLGLTLTEISLSPILKQPKVPTPLIE